MSNKKLAILGITAFVMLAWAIVQSKVSNKTNNVSSGSRYLISGVNADDIDSIVIKSDGKSLTLKRKSNKFFVVNKDNYPAETEKVNDLITDCLEIQVTQMVTDNPANHADLGVTEDKAQKVITFLKPDGSSLFGIVVGNTREKSQSTYVRLTSNNKVYEAVQAPYINTEPMDFIKKQLVAIVHNDIQMVSVESPEGKYELIPKTDSEDIEMINIPEGKKLKQTEAKNVFNALSSLDFTDVMKNTGDLTFDKHYICKLFNTTEFTFNIATKDDKTYVTCKALFTEGVPKPKPGETTISEEQLKEIEEKQKLDTKADDFTSRNMGWVYEISNYKAKYLTMNMSDLLEDAEEIPASDVSIDPNAVLNKIQEEEPNQ